MRASPGVRIREALAAIDDAPAVGPRGRLHALGWATVELDRAAAELAADLRLPADAFAAAAGSEVLGAYCRIARGVLPGGVALVIVEPATEGRLAATLARDDEGPVAAWFALDAGLAAVAAPGAPTAPVSPGPFGPERLLPGGSGGLLRLLVAPGAGTIRV